MQPVDVSGDWVDTERGQVELEGGAAGGAGAVGAAEPVDVFAVAAGCGVGAESGEHHVCAIESEGIEVVHGGGQTDVAAVEVQGPGARCVGPEGAGEPVDVLVGADGDGSDVDVGDGRDPQRAVGELEQAVDVLLGDVEPDVAAVEVERERPGGVFAGTARVRGDKKTSESSTRVGSAGSGPSSIPGTEKSSIPYDISIEPSSRMWKASRSLWVMPMSEASKCIDQVSVAVS